MLPVVVSIALLVLLSVTVIAVVADEGKSQPTSGRGPHEGSRRPERAEPDTPAGPVPVEAPSGAVRREPDPARPAMAGIATFVLPRHRVRSSVLLVLYVLVAGVLMAAVVGAAVAGLTVVLRDAVTS